MVESQQRSRQTHRESSKTAVAHKAAFGWENLIDWTLFGRPLTGKAFEECDFRNSDFAAVNDVDIRNSEIRCSKFSRHQASQLLQSFDIERVDWSSSCSNSEELVKSTDIISWLEGLYRRNCDRTSNSKFEILIAALQNRGWSVTIDLAGTSLSGASCDRVDIERGPDDWVRCWMKGDIWEAIGGIHNLKEILELFRQWVELQKRWGERSHQGLSNQLLIQSRVMSELGIQSNGASDSAECWATTIVTREVR
jgi:hypothetical protein